MILANNVKEYINNIFRSSNSITLKVVLYLLVFSTIFTFFSTSLQLYTNYEKDLESIKEQLVKIEAGYGYAFALGVWNIDEVIIEKLATGIISLPDIQCLEVISEDLDETLVYGIKTSGGVITHSFPLIFIDNENKELNLGTVKLTATTDNIHNRFTEVKNVVLITEIIKALLISLFMFIMIYRLFTRHLNDIIDYFSITPLVWLKKKLVLKHYNYKDLSNADEIQKVVEAINNLRKKQLEYISDIEDAEKESRILSENILKANEELNSYKNDLEAKVIKRTNELQITLENLKKSQDQLVESEKMASLGQLVIGLAHEINTPIGVAVTAASYMSDETTELLNKSSSGKLTKKDLDYFINKATDTSNLILNNLARASRLIGSFKQISVNETIEKKITINMNQFINEILSTLQSKLEEMNIEVELMCSSEIIVRSYPFAISQIINNLIDNSVDHAFEGVEKRLISIEVTMENKAIKLTYKDSGVGIPEKDIKQIFDPFFTTNRGGGSIGLGLSIIYNIITQVLMGYIKCKSNGGTVFEIGFDI